MTDKAVIEMLAAYTDSLNRGEADCQIYLRQAPDQYEELESLLSLAEQIKQALVPVQPSPAFVKNLIQRLVVAPNERVARLARGHRRGVVIGAAAVGSALSVIGIIAYLVRSRAQMKARVASIG